MFSKLVRCLCFLLFASLFVASVNADAWRYRYSEPTTLSTAETALGEFEAQSLTNASQGEGQGLWSAGFRVQNVNEAAAPSKLLRFGADGSVELSIPDVPTQALYSNRNGALVAIGDARVTSFGSEGIRRFDFSLPFSTEFTEVAPDDQGNALLLRGNKAQVVSLFGVNDLGNAVAIVGAAEGGWIAKMTPERALRRISLDGTESLSIAIANSDTPLALASASSGGLRALFATSNGFAINEYSAEGVLIARFTRSTSSTQISTVRKAYATPIAPDGTWRVMVVGTAEPTFLVINQQNFQVQTLPAITRCLKECRLVSFASARSLFFERTDAGVKVLSLDSSGQVLNDGVENIASIHASTELSPELRVSIRAGLIRQSSEEAPLNSSPIVPSVLSSIGMRDYFESSLVASLSTSAAVARIARISSIGQISWQSQLRLPINGVGAIANNSERYCTAFALRDSSVDVACNAIVDATPFATDSVPIPTGSQAKGEVRKMIAQMAPDGTFGLLIERVDANALSTVEYAQFGADVRLKNRRTLTLSAAQSRILDLRINAGVVSALVLSAGEVVLDRNGESTNFGSGTGAQFAASGGALLSLSSPMRLLRIDDSNQSIYQRADVAALESVADSNLRLVRSNTEILALNEGNGAILWRRPESTASIKLLQGAGQLLRVAASTNTINVDLLNAVNGASIATRTFPCASDCTLSAALLDVRGLRLLLDRRTPAGTEMQLVGTDGPFPAPALALTQPGLSGAWFDPNTSGQGLNITRIANSPTVFVGWFTYASGEQATQNSSGQRWYSLQGDIAPDTANEVELGIFETTGGAFTRATPAATSRRVGTASLRLVGCEQLTLRYRFDAMPSSPAREGQLLLERLTPAHLSCASIPAAQASSALLPVAASPSSIYEGPWYDPEASGQGLFFNVWPKFAGVPGAPISGLFGGWFTYDVTPNDVTAQHWFALQSLREPGPGELLSFGIFQAVGGVFDAKVSGGVAQLGSGTLEPQNCDTLLMRYRFNGAGSAGPFANRQGEIRLRRLGGCQR